jgi:hypothetical protein
MKTQKENLVKGDMSKKVFLRPGASWRPAKQGKLKEGWAKVSPASNTIRQR